MALLGGYLSQVRQAVDRQDEAGFAALLALDGPQSGAQAAAQATRANANIMQMCERTLQSPVDEVRRENRYHFNTSIRQDFKRGKPIPVSGS